MTSKHLTPKRTLAIAAVLLLLPGLAAAVVNYEKGRITINNVVLLQDADDPSAYYYLPPYPTLARNKQGDFEFVCLKFVDPVGDTSGGLLHFLVTFELPPEEVEELQEKLEETMPNAKVMGPVPLFEKQSTGNTKEPVEPAFKVVSAVLNDTAEGGMTRSMVSSGHAPLTPGSRAPVAAILNQHGATLLWETLGGSTSDISVSISAYYEAKVEGFHGRIKADVSTVYNHYSAILNKQKGYKKRELRDITDEMIREAVIEVEIFDRAEGLGIDTTAMRRVADLVTDKLVDIIFDTENGLTKLPEREQAVEKGQIRQRQERGAFVKWFAGEGNPEYITDNQFVMKNREDIQQNTFLINLSATTTIKVPFHTSGNMGGLYYAYGDNEEMFRVVNLADPSFQKREIFYTVDRDYINSFKETINFVTVNFRKNHPDGPATTSEIQFTAEDIQEGLLRKSIPYPRLGQADSGWLDYQYRVSWSVYGRDTVRVPSKEDEWLDASDAVINLMPPFEKTSIEIEADTVMFDTNNVVSGVVEVRYKLLGKDKSERRAVLRASDSEPINSFTIYHDEKAVPEMRITWYGKSGLGRKVEDWQPVDTTYLFLSPPEFKPAEEEPTGDE